MMVMPRKGVSRLLINVVPYIDVMLVLLIIFMVTAPLITQGVKVDLPKATAEPLSEDSKPPLVASVDAEGRYYLNQGDSQDTPMQADELATLVAAHLQVEPDTPVMVNGDGAVSYNQIVSIHGSAAKSRCAVSWFNDRFVGRVVVDKSESLTLPLIYSIAIHAVIAGVLLISFEFTPSTPEAMEVNLNQSDIEPAEEIVSAVSVDKAKVQEQVDRMKRQKAEAEAAEQRRIERLERRAEEARKAREREEQRQKEIERQQEIERQEAAQARKEAEQAKKEAQRLAEERAKAEAAAKEAERRKKEAEEAERRAAEERRKREEAERRAAEREAQLKKEMEEEARAVRRQDVNKC